MRSKTKTSQIELHDSFNWVENVENKMEYHFDLYGDFNNYYPSIIPGWQQKLL